jgi:hypothetical protein
MAPPSNPPGLPSDDPVPIELSMGYAPGGAGQDPGAAPAGRAGLLAPDSPFLSLFGLTDAAPEKAVGNCGKAYWATATLGLTASATASLAGITAFGIGNYAIGSVAKIVGDLAGYDPVNNAIAGAVSHVFLNTPMEYWARKTGRPQLPNAGQALDFYRGRHTSDSPGADPDDVGPRSARELLQFAGYPEKWIDMMLEEAFYRPGFRYLALIAQAANLPDSWLEENVRRLGYRPDHIEHIVKRLRWQADSAGVNAQVAELTAEHVKGYLTREELEKNLKDIGYPEGMQERTVVLSSWELWRKQKDRHVAIVLDKYDSGQMKDAELDDALAAHIPVEEVRKLVVLQAQLGRSHTIWRTGATEVARQSRAIARTQYVHNKMDVSTYKKYLTALGYDENYITLDLALADEEKWRFMAADLKAWIEPDLREKVYSGEIDLEKYRTEMTVPNIPGPYLDAEVNYVKAMAEYRRKGRVERYLVGPYEEAYVYNLIGWGELAAIMDDAGWKKVEITAKEKVLDARKARLAKDLKTATQRRDDSLVKAALAAELKRQKEAAAAAAVLARAAAAVVKAGGAMAPAAVASTLSRIQAAYDAAAALLPDNVWATTQEISAAVAAAGPLDLAHLDSLLGDLASQLDSAAELGLPS